MLCCHLTRNKWVNIEWMCEVERKYWTQWTGGLKLTASQLFITINQRECTTVREIETQAKACHQRKIPKLALYGECILKLDHN
jgi:hypothetical protein